MGARIFYATHRNDPRVTEREAALLRSLGARGAPAPADLLFDTAQAWNEDLDRVAAMAIAPRSPLTTPLASWFLRLARQFE